MKRLWNHAGETLVETMFSLAIISVTFVFLTGAVVAATRVNSKIRNSGSEFRIDDSNDSDDSDKSDESDESNESVTVTISAEDKDNPGSYELITAPIPVKIYKSVKNGDENEYYYYRKDDSKSGGGGG